MNTTTTQAATTNTTKAFLLTAIAISLLLSILVIVASVRTAKNYALTLIGVTSALTQATLFIAIPLLTRLAPSTLVVSIAFTAVCEIQVRKTLFGHHLISYVNAFQGVSLEYTRTIFVWKLSIACSGAFRETVFNKSGECRAACPQIISKCRIHSYHFYYTYFL
jgi:hypothetical protein